jgi:hypothetical protein
MDVSAHASRLDEPGFRTIEHVAIGPEGIIVELAEKIG